jgi:hypothetical protein
MTSTFVAVLLDDLSLFHNAALEAAWTLLGLDALTGDCVEDHTGHAGAAGGAAGAGWAGEMHVEAGWLAVCALVPYLISLAHLDLGTVVLSAEPLSVGACACVALFIACSSVLEVSSLEGALAFSLRHALVQFFIDYLSWETAAAGYTFLYTTVWLNLSACLSAHLTAFLVHSSSSTLYGTAAGCSPVCYGHSVQGAFTGIGGDGCTWACGLSVFL